jgi:hypothetical protein
MVAQMFDPPPPDHTGHLMAAVVDNGTPYLSVFVADDRYYPYKGILVIKNCVKRGDDDGIKDWLRAALKMATLVVENNELN